MNDTQPLEYERVAQSLVYETRAPDSVGWAGYLLPPPGQAQIVFDADLPSKIPLADSLDRAQGHYLFSATRPALLDSDPDGFAQAVLDVLAKAIGPARAALWLPGGLPPEAADFAAFGLSFGPDGAGGHQVTSTLNARIGATVGFLVLPPSSVAIDTLAGGLRISARNRPSNPFIGFLAGAPPVTQPLGVLLTSDGGAISALVPVSGANSGCFTFAAQMMPPMVFGPGGVSLGLELVVNDSTGGSEKSVAYGVYNVNLLPGAFPVAGTVDPSDPVNSAISTADLQTGHLRSGFTVGGAPQLQSYYFTAEGRAIVLTPLGGGLTDAAPPLSAGGLAWASSAKVLAPSSQRVPYLTPSGSHGLSAAGVGPGQPQALLGGLFGSERLSFQTHDPQRPTSENDRLFFLPSQPGYAPVFPFEAAGLTRPDSGAVRPRLTRDHLVAWAALLGGASAVEYRSEPEGSALYGKGDGAVLATSGGATVLVSAPPSTPLAHGTGQSFPLMPYGAAASAGVDGATLTEIESQIIAATRRASISAAATEVREARRLARASAPAEGTSQRATPQGFLVDSDDATGAYLRVLMARSLNRRGRPLRCDPTETPDHLPFAFDKPTSKVEEALETNQLFLVAVDDAPFDDSAQGACFESTVDIAGWTMTARIGKDATPTSYRNVVIFKFCSGSLAERVRNPNRWTAPEDFSLLAGTSEDMAALSYTGLSQWLQDYVAQGVARASGRSADFYRSFARIVTDPDWNGVIVLAADLGSGDLPPEIAALAGGIDMTRLSAHHFGFDASRVEVDPATGGLTMGAGDSSLFGLIDYEDVQYAQNLDGGVDPDVPVPVDTAGDLDFTVLTLKSLFENARLTRFESRVQLTVKRLFGADVQRLVTAGAPEPFPGIVIAGSYVDQGGEPSYVFEQSAKSVLLFDSNVLPAVAFDRVQMNTLGTTGEGPTAIVASRFVVWGAFDFAELDDRQGRLLDVTSFGSPKGTPAEALGVGLSFSNLVIGMAFPRATPSARTFTVDTANLAWDGGASTARPDSLFRGFGLSLQSFVSGTGGQTPADLGFLPVTSTLDLTEIDSRWFGVAYDVTLGGPGALASAAGFSSRLLVGWSPTSRSGDGSHALFVGMSLPGAAPGAKLFSVQGVLKVGVGAISILRQPVPKAPGREADGDDYFYCLRIDDIAVQIFGIVKLPPSANIQFFLFGDPKNTGSLGWYAAHVADDDPGCDQQLAFSKLGARPPSPEAAT